MKITPMRDYLVVSPLKEVTKTKMGLELEAESDQLKSQGIIIACGDDVEYKYIAGDRVFYRHFEINEIGDQVLVREEDVIAIIEEEK